VVVLPATSVEAGAAGCVAALAVFAASAAPLAWACACTAAAAAAAAAAVSAAAALVVGAASFCFEAESVLSLPLVPLAPLAPSAPFAAPLCWVPSLWLADFVLPVLFELSEVLALFDESSAGGASCTLEPFDADADADGVGAGALGAVDGVGAAAWFCAWMLCCSVVENGSTLPAFAPFDALLPDEPLVEPSSELISERGDMLDLV
jgi:hypothetical protein